LLPANHSPFSNDGEKLCHLARFALFPGFAFAFEEASPSATVSRASLDARGATFAVFKDWAPAAACRGCIAFDRAWPFIAPEPSYISRIFS
jgi:hypothetical protein